MKRQFRSCVLATLFIPASCRPHPPENSATKVMDTRADTSVTCDIIIAGGTTAATAAAISAATEIERLGLGSRKVCLFEPTNWPGGQMTASGVGAIDFDHHTKEKFGERINLGTMRSNITKLFASWMDEVAANKVSQDVFTMDGNAGRCWVSTRCYLPSEMAKIIRDELSNHESKGSLEVFYEAVPKQLTKSETNRLSMVEFVQRFPKNAEERDGMYNRRFSTVVEDWYSRADSPNYEKRMVRAETRGSMPVIIDATEWGELLVLSGAKYSQGAPQGETCGQAIVYPLALEIRSPDSPPVPPGWYADVQKLVTENSKSLYSHKGGGGSFEKNWRYRRMKATGNGGVWSTPPNPGDISQINVGDGNDYPFEYLFPSTSVAAASVRDWKGGVRVEVLSHAEIHSLGYYGWLREHDDGTGLGKFLWPSQAHGTANGLSKVPYMRDTRRSVGVGGYQIPFSALLEGTNHADTVAIGVYAADQHPVSEGGCQLPILDNPYPKPFHLPLRALTNSSIPNLLVAGKTMAQDFVTNAATRLHPIEFASGTASGVAAIYMNETNKDAQAALAEEAVDVIRKRVMHHQTVAWSR